MLEKNNEITYPFSRDVSINAILMAINDEPRMKRVSYDREAGNIQLSVGMTIWSWGEKMVIRVGAVDRNITKVVFESGSNYAVIDYGKNMKNIEKLINRISSILNSQACI